MCSPLHYQIPPQILPDFWRWRGGRGTSLTALLDRCEPKFKAGATDLDPKDFKGKRNWFCV